MLDCSKVRSDIYCDTLHNVLSSMVWFTKYAMSSKSIRYPYAYNIEAVECRGIRAYTSISLCE